MASIGARMLLPVSLLLAGWAGQAEAADPETDRHGWIIEQGTDHPSYAAVAPAVANVNIDTVVLACEEAWGTRILQLQLYLTGDGPLQPTYPQLRPLKAAPQAVIAVDGRAYPVALLFAEDYAVLADFQEGHFPALSGQLVAAMQTGSQMAFHFDLLEEWPGQPPSFDSEAVVDLQAPGGREAIAAMRRCADPPDPLQAGLPRSP
jgi:hypothetical protein